MRINRPILVFLKWVSLLLKTIFLFFPSLFYLFLAGFVLWSLPQGEDIIRLCLTSRWVTGLVFTIAILFWVIVTWYTTRLVAYNHDELYNAQYIDQTGTVKVKIGKGLLFHFPRLMGYTIFLITIMAILKFANSGKIPGVIWYGIIILDYLLYGLFHWLTIRLQVFAESSGRQQLLLWLRIICLVMLVILPLISIIFWSAEHTWLIITTLFCCQLGFLFLVVTRKHVVTYINSKKGVKHFFMQGYLDWVLNRKSGDRRITMQSAADTEQLIFVIFNIFALIGGITYACCVFILPVALTITPLPLLFLAFGVLLGMGNFVSLLSYRSKINIHFLVLLFIVLAGLFTEAHWARTLKNQNVDYRQKSDLESYMHNWLYEGGRDKVINQSGQFPVFIVLADGGASRSGYWTTLVLSHLAEKTATGKQPFLRHLLCLSGASGGAVGHATFLAALGHKELRTAGSSKLSQTTTDFLGNDFLCFTLARLLGPDIAASIFAPIVGDRAFALEYSLENAASNNILSADMKKGFSRYLPQNGADYFFPIVCLNTTRMQDGQPGVVCNIKLDSAFFGSRIDVLESLQKGNDLRLSTAMILGSRFPYMSPAGRINNSYFVDGGYFDNSGAGFAHELLQKLQKMQESGMKDNTDSALMSKLRFYVIHIANTPYAALKLKRVQAVKNDLLAPLLTLAGSYSTQTSVNDSRLSRYLNERNGFPSTLTINLYLNDVKENIPMNWVTSKAIRALMDQRVNLIPEMDSLVARLNKGQTNSLLTSLETNSAPDPNQSKSIVEMQGKISGQTKKETAH